MKGKKEISNKLTDWYNENQRDLPWRHSRDPYVIWLSEIILQQTRVAQGLPYFKSFIRKFPSVRSLATAKLDLVLRAWQGLGYYSRARNMHACAKVIVKQHRGVFPSEYEELKKLPGIGSYTAAAIASIAFGQPVPVVDGNVYRVLSRWFGIHEDIASTAGKKIFFEQAKALIDDQQAGEFNQAMMEFGALQCVPKNPDCSACIFFANCYARKRKMQMMLPVKLKKVKTRTRYFNYFAIRVNNQIALKKRKDNDIWKGLYDFHLIEGKRDITKSFASDKLLATLNGSASIDFVSKYYTHKLTHQLIKSRVIIISIDVRTKKLLPQFGLKLYPTKKISELPKPVLISRFFNDLDLVH